MKALMVSFMAVVLFAGTVFAGDGWVLWVETFRNGGGHIIHMWDVVEGYDTAKECKKEKTLYVKSLMKVNLARKRSGEIVDTAQVEDSVTETSVDDKGKVKLYRTLRCLPGTVDPREKEDR